MMGKIGKPQKSSKHKKIKAIDPFYIGNRVADRKAVGANLEPRNADEQEIPFSLREVMKLNKKTRNMKARLSRKQMKKERKAALKKQNEMKEKGMTRPLKPVPEFKQGKKEPDEAFLNRIERETQLVIAKAQFEEKYKVDLDADGTQVKRKTKKSKKNRERLKEKKLKKKQKVIEKIEEKASGFEKLKDDIKFGEIVMEPPSLTAKPRKSANIGELKPGKRKLLLNEIIQHNIGQKGVGMSAKPRQIGQTIKRKELAPFQQHLMDQEREKAILQYRELKKQRLEKMGT